MPANICGAGTIVEASCHNVQAFAAGAFLYQVSPRLQRVPVDIKSEICSRDVGLVYWGWEDFPFCLVLTSNTRLIMARLDTRA